MKFIPSRNYSSEEIIWIKTNQFRSACGLDVDEFCAHMHGCVCVCVCVCVCMCVGVWLREGMLSEKQEAFEI